MKHSILQQLYDGCYSPSDEYLPKTKKFRRLQRRHYRNYETLYKNLETIDNKLASQFSQVLDEQQDIANHEKSAMFIGGIRFGVNLILEIISDEKNPPESEK